MPPREPLPLFKVRDVVTAAGTTFTPTERLVALCIADHMNQGGEAWPSLRRISGWTGLSKPTVWRAIVVLTEAGIFARTPGGSRAKTGNETTRYRLGRCFTTQHQAVSPRNTREVNGETGGVSPRYTERPKNDQGERPIVPPPAVGSTAIVLMPVKARPWTAEACDDWTTRFEGTAPGGRIGKALRPLVERLTWDVVRPAWRRYLAEKDPEFATPQDFASKPAPWLNGDATRAPGRPLSKDDAMTASSAAWARRG